ncbi:MAG: hypothetical protein IJ008_04355 [Clostridia bacterium]|nr:hypothetical protein [Clostridia bacterium]
MKLSDIMWIEAGYGKSRRVMPFYLDNNIICSLADDRLFQLDSTKSLYDNLYEICQHEYNYSTVIINKDASGKISRLNTTNPNEPTILNFGLPKLFTLMHKQEYKEKKDMTVSKDEAKKLSNYFTKKLGKALNNAATAERTL